MLTLQIGLGSAEPLDVLCLGAHADDIEIGCGATLLEVARSGRPLTCHWVVLSAEGVREREARASAAAFLEGCLEADVRVASFREGFFPYIGTEVKEYVEALARELSPDLVFTHHRDDLHQDHRLVADLSWNAFRDHLILEYEVPKYDGDLGRPNVYVPADAEACARKVQLLMTGFPSQATRHWFTEETFSALLRLRGVEARSATGYAEAFLARKITLSTDR